MIASLEKVLPLKMQDVLRQDVFEELKTKEPETPPQHPYHTIGVEWPLVKYDGHIHADESILEKKHHTAWFGDHLTVILSIHTMS